MWILTSICNMQPSKTWYISVWIVIWPLLPIWKHHQCITSNIHSNSSKWPTSLLNTHNMTPFKWFQLKQNYMCLSMEWHWTISPYLSKYALQSKAQMQTSSISITVSKLLKILIGYPRSKLAVLHGVTTLLSEYDKKLKLLLIYKRNVQKDNRKPWQKCVSFWKHSTAKNIKYALGPTFVILARITSNFWWLILCLATVLLTIGTKSKNFCPSWSIMEHIVSIVVGINSGVESMVRTKEWTRREAKSVISKSSVNTSTVSKAILKQNNLSSKSVQQYEH